MTRKSRRALVLAAFLLAGVPAIAQVPDSENDPSFLLLVDTAKCSAVHDAQLRDEIMKQVKIEVDRLGIGAMVYASSVGGIDHIPATFATRILTRSTSEGMTRSMVLSRLRDFLDGMDAQPNGGDKSALVRGWLDASQHLNPQAKGNSVIFVSDLVEGTDADCSNVATCKLPDPDYKLTGTRLLGLGVGLCQTAEKTRQIFRSWEGYFKKSGISVHLFQTGY